MFNQSTEGDVYRQLAAKLVKSPHLRDVKTWYTNASDKGPTVQQLAPSQCPRVDMMPVSGTNAWITEGTHAGEISVNVECSWFSKDAALGLDFKHALIKAIKEPIPELCEIHVGEAIVRSWNIQPTLTDTPGFTISIQVTILSEISTGQPG